MKMTHAIVMQAESVERMRSSDRSRRRGLRHSSWTMGLLLIASLGLSGCSFIGKKVNAYERNILSKPGMSLVENGNEQAKMNHMYNAREGSTGGVGGAGGGCGCN